jgi:hypothetical protein
MQTDFSDVMLFRKNGAPDDHIPPLLDKLGITYKIVNGDPSDTPASELRPLLPLHQRRAFLESFVKLLREQDIAIQEMRDGQDVTGIRIDPTQSDYLEKMDRALQSSENKPALSWSDGSRPSAPSRRSVA